MKLFLYIASVSLAFAGTVTALPPLVPEAGAPDFKENESLDARRARTEPEFVSMFTSASFLRDPAYHKEKAELDEAMQAMRSNHNRSTVGLDTNRSQRVSFTNDYCVGVAWNPHRTRIFENRTDCTTEKWTTLASISTFKPIPALKSRIVDGCVGIAHNPTRSMYMKGHKNCNRDGWAHDFEMPLMGWGTDQHFLTVWEASDPHRMIVSADGVDMKAEGWTYRTRLPATLISYPMTPVGIRVLMQNLPQVAHEMAIVAEIEDEMVQSGRWDWH